jgi:GT2 family glycosyltransferase
MTAGQVTAVVIAWNSRDDLPRALASLAGVAEILVVDNASEDGSADVALSLGARVIANPENRGFARAANQAILAARTPLVLLLNPDAELRPGALAALLRGLAADPRVAVVAPLTRNEDGTVQVSFGPDLGPRAERRQKRLVEGVARRDPRALDVAERLARGPRPPDWLSACCWLARREALLAVGLFDEGFFLYEEDADLCRRLRAAAWRLALVPEAEAVHRLGRSAERSHGRARRAYDRSHLRYYAKWNGPLLTLVLRLWLLLRGRP